MTHTYHIDGMTCGSCVAKVKSELLKLGDVLSADVQLAEPQATVTMQHHIPTSVLQQAVARAGRYQITEGTEPMVATPAAKDASGNSYYPIFLIFAYIAGATLL